MALLSLADSYSALGEKDEAFEFLERAYRERVGVMIFLDVYPAFDNIRPAPRYTDLLHRMGLPEVSLPKLS
jgi:hypothetical protein